MDEISEKTCRVCFKNKETVFPLFEKLEGQETSHYERLVKKTKLPIEVGDIGPTSICSDCVTELDGTVSYLEKCERSSRVLAATYVRGFNEYSNFRFETTGVEYIEYNAVELIQEQEESNATATRAPVTQPQPYHDMSNLCTQCNQRGCCHVVQYSHTCRYCSKVFMKKLNNQLRCKRTKVQREWVCPLCNKQQVSTWHAEPQKPYTCSVLGCGRTFISKRNLYLHVQKHDERLFECKYCKKVFTNERNLTVHIKIHTGRKPYICTICDKRYASDKIAPHMRVRHPWVRSRTAFTRPAPARPAPARPAPARPAPARPVSARPLPPRPRVLRDDPFSCLYCGARYSYRHDLDRHIRRQHRQPATQTASTSSSQEARGNGSNE